MKQRVPEITEKLTGLDMDVWDRGYYHQTDEGCWYEVYVNYAMRKRWSYENIIDEIAELNHTKTLNPCIIFVPVGEVKYNLKYLTHYLLHNIPTS